MKLLSLSTHIIISLAVILFANCKKFVDVAAPNDRLVNATVFSNDASAEAAMVGIYSELMSKDYSWTSGTIGWYCGLAADELVNYKADPAQAEFYNNSLTTTNNNNTLLWQQLYTSIYAANAIIENLDVSAGVSEETKKRLGGESKFIRAFAHFYLTNLFGKVPLILTTDYQANTASFNSDSATLYEQILSDLKDAVLALPDNYTLYGGQRTRPTKMAANALLARVYLYSKQYEKSIAASTTIIDDPLFELLPLNDIFLKNSREAVWQLIPLINNINTSEARFFVLTSNPASSNGGVALAVPLVYSFEAGDLRRQQWIDSINVDGSQYYFPYKYKVISTGELSEYYTVLRLGEQLLIRAESYIKLGMVPKGIEDINRLRDRARSNQPGGLPVIEAMGLSLEDAALLVERERTAELFSEWGHRWFDLKRWGKADQLLEITKGNNWQSTDKLFPIPQIQVLADPNIEQNPGY